MRLILLVICLFSSCVLLSQSRTGINTLNPTSTLDVNGDLRIRLVDSVQDTPQYILTADSLGLVGKVNKGLINETPVSTESGVETKKVQYYGAYNESLTVENGLFEFRTTGGAAEPAEMFYQLRPVRDPGGTVSIVVGVLSRWGGNGGSTPSVFNVSISFDSSDWQTWKTISSITGNLNGHNAIVSVDVRSSPNLGTDPVFYNLFVQRIDSGLKTLIVNRY